MDKAKASKGKNLWDLFATFFKIGAFTFGGGYAMVSVIERDLVKNKKWITENELLDMIIIAESTPGVIAVNSATFVGYKKGGVLGGITATFGAVLPSFIVILLLSYFILAVQNNIWVTAVFKGIRCAVIILIANAVIKLSKPVKKTPLSVTIMAISFVLSLFIGINTIYIILGGGFFGIVYYAIKYHGRSLPPEAGGRQGVREDNVLPEEDKKDINNDTLQRPDLLQSPDSKEPKSNENEMAGSGHSESEPDQTINGGESSGESKGDVGK